VLREIFGTDREESIGGRKKLYNEKVQSSYCSANTVRVIKLSSMK
jgi:hypothetical protein